MCLLVTKDDVIEMVLIELGSYYHPAHLGFRLMEPQNGRIFLLLYSISKEFFF